MLNNPESSFENIILVQKEEVSFFEKFLDSKKIIWNEEQKDNGILVLSKSLVGYISTPLRKINLKPKYREVSLEHVLRLYYFVYGYSSNEDDAMLDMNTSTQFTNLIPKFINLLTDNISIGILQDYNFHYDHLRYIRGNVNYKQTYINSISKKKYPVYTNHSSLSLDNSINKIIVAALRKISEISNFFSISNEILSYFDNISNISTTAQEIFETIEFNSNTKRYEKVTLLGAMIYDNLFFDSSLGHSGGESFIVNYDILFEKFVRKILVTMTKQHDFSVWQAGKIFANIHLDSISYDQRIYQPDILFRFNPSDQKYGYIPTAYGVIDVKNKAYSHFKNADIYQMMTYSSLLCSEKNILIYPSFFRKEPVKLTIDTEELRTPEVVAVFINIIGKSAQSFKKDIDILIRDIYEVLDN